MEKVAKSRETLLTIEQINSDRIIELAEKYWSPQKVNDRLPYDSEIIDQIYREDLLGTRFSVRRSRVLEFSQYLENYLWPNFIPDKISLDHVISIAAMINEKFRQRVPAWNVMKENPGHVAEFFRRIVYETLENTSITYDERMVLILFLTHSFNSIEHEFIREQLKHYTTISLLTCVQEGRRSVIFRKFKNWGKIYNKLMKRGFNEQQDWNRKYLHRLLLSFIAELENIPPSGELKEGQLQYCERFLEFIIDLESALPTRRFFNFLLADTHFVLRCARSPLPEHANGGLFRQLLDILKFYVKFEIDEETGEPLTASEVIKKHYDQVHHLQITSFHKYPELRNFSLSSIASVDARETLTKIFSPLSLKTLLDIARSLHFIPIDLTAVKENNYRTDKDFILELIVSYHEREISQLEKLNSLPLYPTENIMWDENVVPCEYFSGECCLPLPKLNLQFLTFHDYLYRNLTLFRLESTYEIKQDIEDSIVRLSPWQAEDGSTYFGGWARMAQPINNFAVVEVSKPNVGERKPSFVRADVTVTLNLRPEIKLEWESLRKHDVCFLLTVRPKMTPGTRYDYTKSVVDQSGLVYVRGCEIEGMLDEAGRVIEDSPEGRPSLPGDVRTFRVFLDTNQYLTDMDAVSAGREDVYETFNVVLRRKPNVNNFKAVLETIRELMNSECVVPEWLRDLILGYGDPAAAHFTNMTEESDPVDFYDTFVNYHHLKCSYPGYEITDKNGRKVLNLPPPYRVTVKDRSGPPSLIVEPQPLLEDGLQLEHFKRNTIWFTPTQVRAIHSGLRHGLTLVVGPPGTGKTDVAVQIINNLYHSHPNERTLIVTHSNQALNHLFEKITQLDVNEKHLLRLGHGEESLDTDKDFSRHGRVNHILASRMYFLSLVKRLQQSLGIFGDMSQSCETAGYFYKHQIFPLWEKFYFLATSKISKEDKESDWVSKNFPFSEFFSYSKPLFFEESWDQDWKIALKHFKFIQRIFEMLEMCQAFELLRSGSDRANYLLVKEAKIIAMTCTHAALKRSELVKLGFTYDNILMEEAAQILEIETFIPLLIQNPQDGYNRLKRWIMIGDHHQLPPIVKNMAFQHYSNMEQSLFARFVRLGVPTIDLDAQGRARPSLCDLYSWRYQGLGNLPHVETSPEFVYANAGFVYDFQLINVKDFNGIGESEPNPHFYQNLAEAEYCVAVFMYMRLLGYPAEKISILTTYNGQKHLLRDVVAARCGSNPLIGVPHKVTTVDKYQGQQNDYILLSLVRTKTVGHLRDVRRLVVALSRARLGLYVFARESLFSNCYELSPAVRQLTARPLKLHLVPGETQPTVRRQGDIPPEPYIVQDMAHMVRLVFDLYNHQVGSMKQTLRRYSPGEVSGRGPGHATALHPGAASSSEDEDEDNVPETLPRKETNKAVEPAMETENNVENDSAESDKGD